MFVFHYFVFCSGWFDNGVRDFNLEYILNNNITFHPLKLLGSQRWSHLGHNSKGEHEICLFILKRNKTQLVDYKWIIELVVGLYYFIRFVCVRRLVE